MVKSEKCLRYALLPLWSAIQSFRQCGWRKILTGVAGNGAHIYMLERIGYCKVCIHWLMCLGTH